jgi:hypothetical protein
MDQLRLLHKFSIRPFSEGLSNHSPVRPDSRAPDPKVSTGSRRKQGETPCKICRPVEKAQILESPQPHSRNSAKRESANFPNSILGLSPRRRTDSTSRIALVINGTDRRQHEMMSPPTLTPPSPEFAEEGHDEAEVDEEQFFDEPLLQHDVRDQGLVLEIGS